MSRSQQDFARLYTGRRKSRYGQRLASKLKSVRTDFQTSVLPHFSETFLDNEDETYVPETLEDRRMLKSEIQQSLDSATEQFLEGPKQPTTVTLTHLRNSCKRDPLSKKLFKYVKRK